MAYFFEINKNSTLPNLRMEIFDGGKGAFYDAWFALQAADVTFSMWDKETGVRKIANAPGIVTKKFNNDCTEQYIIGYDWKERDTKESGVYIGQFTINLTTPVKVEGRMLPQGKLIVPITEELEIHINQGSIKK